MTLRSSAATLVATVVFGGVAPAYAQNLAETSPFMPATRQAAPTVTENAPLELRGIMGRGEGRIFSIYNPTTKQSTWVRLNETGYDFSVRTHDDAAETVSVEFGGRTLNLKLSEAKIAAVAPTPGSRGANLVPQGGPGAQPNARPAPSAEQLRALENVQAEVERRRAARNEALKSP